MFDATRYSFPLSAPDVNRSSVPAHSVATIAKSPDTSGSIQSAPLALTVPVSWFFSDRSDDQDASRDAFQAAWSPPPFQPKVCSTASGRAPRITMAVCACPGRRDIAPNTCFLARSKPSGASVGRSRISQSRVPGLILRARDVYESRDSTARVTSPLTWTLPTLAVSASSSLGV